MMRGFLGGLSVAVAVATCLAGCGKQNDGEARVSEAPSADGTDYLLAAEPASATGVAEVREQAAGDEEVVVTGRIGGSKNPWIDGRAAFSIVDPSLQACSDIPGDGCPVPWDYCCETDRLPASTALVKVVDDEGNLLRTDARKLLGLKELQTVVVRGKAERDDSGNLTILADGVYVKK